MFFLGLVWADLHSEWCLGIGVGFGMHFCGILRTQQLFPTSSSGGQWEHL